MNFQKIFFFLICICILSCNTSNKTLEYQTIVKEVKQEFVPDSRVGIFSIKEILNADKTITLKGQTNNTKALNKLKEVLKTKKLVFIDSIEQLPNKETLGNKFYAIGRNSVLNIRSKPKHSAELGTQGLLGMSLNVLDKKGDFYRVQTPDKYISWVDKGGITLMNQEEYNLWNETLKVIYTATSGHVYTKNSGVSEVVSDIVFGALLLLKSEDKEFYTVTYPDQRIGYIKKKEATLYSNWKSKKDASEENIEHFAKTFLGVPYLWGGTSTKGVDCSGFTKTVYLMNGFVIPRDASQQIHAGKTVDANLAFKNLQKGDLLFFGRKATKNKKQRVTHVGIWLGNNAGEFIHSSGNVHLSSIDPNHKNYDEFNKNRYLGSKRYLGVEDSKIIDLKKETTLKP